MRLSVLCALVSCTNRDRCTNLVFIGLPCLTAGAQDCSKALRTRRVWRPGRCPLTIPLRQAGRRHEALLAQHESVWSHVNQSPIPYRTASGQALAIALVENMSYFDGSFNDGDAADSGERTRRFYPFGRGHVDKIVEARNMDPEAMLFHLPMEASVCEAADGGVPAVLLPEADSVRAPFDRLSDKIVKQFLELRGGPRVPRRWPPARLTAYLQCPVRRPD